MRESISYYEHESMMARMERTIKRLWMASLMLFGALVVSNTLWILHGMK